MTYVTDNGCDSAVTFHLHFPLQKYRGWQTPTVTPSAASDESKNERSESGFDSINDGMFSHHREASHIPLNIPLPPTRTPPELPIAISDFSPRASPMPARKFHRQPMPDINFIESTPSPVLKGNHDANLGLIESESARESEIKIDELNDEPADENARKEGIIAERIEPDGEEDFEIKVWPKDRV